MKHIIDQLPPFEITKGYVARMFHTRNMTIAYVEVEAGAQLPEHAHVHEQVSNVLEGEFEFLLGGQKFLVKAGESLEIPSNVPHSGRALSKCLILDVFQPVREDFRSGNVAYAIR